MTIHVKFHEDSERNIIGTDWYCSELCYRDAGHMEVGAWPGGEESDSCTMCAKCDSVISHGISECWHCIECGEYQYNDTRIFVGMKCGKCAYPCFHIMER